MVTQNSSNNKTAAAGTVLQGQGVGVASDFSTVTYPSTSGSGGVMLRSDGTNNVYSTFTMNNTYGVNDLVYAAAANQLAQLATANDGVLITSHTGVPSWLTGGTTGQILTATTGSPATWQAPATSGTVTSVSGTANRITSTGGNTPVIDISASYVGQASITTLGTITTGTWTGTAIDATHGGTAQTTYASGDILYASAANTLSKLAKGSDTQVLTLAGGLPSWATPTTGTVTSVSGTANRITSTGGNTPVIDISASYVGQASITTLGTVTTGVWNGTAVDLSHGGTNANLTASNGGIFYSTASAGAILAGTATANKVLMSGSSTAPVWSTPTYPNASATSRKIIVSDGTNFVASTETWAVPGTSGNVLTSDGTNWNSAAASGGGGLGSLRNSPEWFDDFTFNNDNTALSPLGSLNWSYGASLGDIVGTADHPGIIQLTSQISSAIISNVTGFSQYDITDSNVIWQSCVLVPTLSTGIQTFTLYAGFTDNYSTPPTGSGIYFSYTDTVNSGHWTLTCVAAGTATNTDSGVAVAANTWYDLAFKKTAGNVAFYINGVLKANITTNIPTAPMDLFFANNTILGTGAFNVDMVYVKMSLLTNRVTPLN